MKPAVFAHLSDSLQLAILLRAFVSWLTPVSVPWLEASPPWLESGSTYSLQYGAIIESKPLADLSR